MDRTRSRSVCFAALLVILAITLCHASCVPRRGLPPTPPLEVSLVPEEAVYWPAEVVEVELSLTNVSSDSITVKPYPPEMQVRPLWNRDEVVISQPGGAQALELEPDSTATLESTWDQKDDYGEQVPSRWYQVSFGITAIETGGRTWELQRRHRVLIQYPQGAMQRVIERDESRTVDEVTITLTRVEMSQTRVEFHIFVVPPEYYPPEPPQLSEGAPLCRPPHPPVAPRAPSIEAQYVVDGVTKKAGTPRIRQEDDGMSVTFGYFAPLDPVPGDAQQLTLRITEIDWHDAAWQIDHHWEGPWEFEISLAQSSLFARSGGV